MHIELKKEFFLMPRTRLGKILVSKPATLAIFVLSTFIAIFINAFGYPVTAAVVFLTFVTADFILILESPDERFIKGMTVIMYGLLVQFLYQILFSKAVSASYWAENLNMAVQAIMLAASGAGGSLIAAYGDRNSTDAEVHAAKHLTIDHSQQMELLIHKLDRMERRFSRLMFALVIAATVTIIVTLIITR